MSQRSTQPCNHGKLNHKLYGMDFMYRMYCLYCMYCLHHSPYRPSVSYTSLSEPCLVRCARERWKGRKRLGIQEGWEKMASAWMAGTATRLRMGLKPRRRKPE